MSEIKYPDVKVQLTGTDGNAFALMGRVTKALKKEMGLTEEECDEFREEAMAGDYDELLRTCARWVKVS